MALDQLFLPLGGGDAGDPGIKVRVGLPYSSDGALAEVARGLGAPTLISANALRRDGGWAPIGRAAWTTPAALDSAGFTMARAGGYTWTVDEYVEHVMTNGGRGAGPTLPFPWEWWSQMDLCCEPEIAGDAAEVRARVEGTAQLLGECLEAWAGWRAEGIEDVPPCLPILQGWTPADYLRSWELMQDTIRRFWEATADEDLYGLEAVEADDPWWPFRRADGTVLIGVGSVCRRQVSGDAGVMAIVASLHRALPPWVRLHLFGVKGPALGPLTMFRPRVESSDSMAWNSAARWAAGKAGIPNTAGFKGEFLARWYHANASL